MEHHLLSKPFQGVSEKPCFQADRLGRWISLVRQQRFVWLTLLLVVSRLTFAQQITTVAGGNGAGSAANQFGSPWGVFVDPLGNIYVSDFNQHRVQKFPPNSTMATNGTTVAGTGIEGNAGNQLRYPKASVVDATGNLYVADQNNPRIQKYAPGATQGVTVAGTGVQGSAANQLDTPTNLFMDGSGNLYVTDRSNSRIQKFPANSIMGTNGTTVAGGNGSGSAMGQFNEPNQIFVDALGNLYVVDTYNHRIQKFPPNSTKGTAGTIVAGGNGAGSGVAQLNTPLGLYVDGSGNLYVLDMNNNRVQKFASGSTQGITVAGGNGTGSAANQLNSPSYIFVDGHDQLYIADRLNFRIQKYNLSTSQTDLAISLTNNQTSVQAGSSITYILTVSNIGPSTVSNATVTDNFPTSLMGVTWTASGAGGGTVAASGSGNLQESVNLPVGGSVTFTVKATVSVSASGNLSNTATVTAPVGVIDPSPGNNSATDTDAITPATPTITGLAASAAAVCVGSPVTFTATVGQVTGSYGYTLTNGTSAMMGTTAGSAFSQVLTASGSGQQSFTLTVSSSGQAASATTPVTVNTLPMPLIDGLSGSLCQNGSAVTLTGNGSGGLFTIDGITATSLTPASLTVGQHTVTYSVTTTSGCSATTSQTVTIKETPAAPALVTASGQSYPAGVSSLMISQNTGNVILTVSGCLGGTISWNGGNSTTLAVSTTSTGVLTYTATCTSNGCTSPAGTATLTVVAPTLKVFSRDPDNGQLNSNTIKPYLLLQNVGTTPIAYSSITARYYLTTENNIPLIFQKNYVQIGQNNVQIRYVPLVTPLQGATGYIEYSFSGAAGSLAPMSNSGSIETQINKQDYTAFNQLDDYSYVNNSAFSLNSRITAYQNGVIFYGTEPGTPVASPRQGVVEAQLQVSVLGNPVLGQQAQIEIRGVEGQAVQLELTDGQGRQLHQQRIPQAGVVERVSVPTGTAPGLLLLQVNTSTQRLFVKLLKS